MVDMTEFTRNKNGMEEEYRKILGQEIWMIRANGHTKDVLDSRYEELRRRKERFFDTIQNMMVEISLQQRALAEISSNWNNKEYWSEE